MKHVKLFLLGLPVVAFSAVVAFALLCLFVLMIFHPWVSMVVLVVVLSYPAGWVYRTWLDDMKDIQRGRDE